MVSSNYTHPKYNVIFSLRQTDKLSLISFLSRKINVPLPSLFSASCWCGWFWPGSSPAHCHPVRGPSSVSVAIREADRWCPVSATGPKCSLPPWIFHLWILLNQCSVFAFPDRDYGSAFFTPLLMSLYFCVFVPVSLHLSSFP